MRIDRYSVKRLNILDILGNIHYWSLVPRKVAKVRLLLHCFILLILMGEKSVVKRLNVRGNIVCLEMGEMPGGKLSVGKWHR